MTKAGARDLDRESLALYAHLRQLAMVATNEDGQLLRPLAMSKPDLLLASASLRALLLDDTGTPLLLSRLMSRNPTLVAFECNISMLLLSAMNPPAELHVSDLLSGYCVNKEMEEYYSLDQTREFMVVHTDPAEFACAMSRASIWTTTTEEADKLSAYVSVANGAPMQLGAITRRNVALTNWCNLQIGLLRTTPITRGALIRYAANKLGGVHFDSKRLPQSRDEDGFRMLATAMDWNQQAFMHAALVGVAICCVELLRSQFVFELYSDLDASFLPPPDPGG